MIIYSTPKKLVKLRRLYRETESSKGFTLIEILVVLMLIGVMTALVAPNIRFGNDPLKDRTNRIASDFKLVRAKAMSQTSAYRISYFSTTKLKVESAKSCFETNPSNWIVDPSFTDEDLSLTEAQDVQGIAKSANIQFTNAVATKLDGTPVTPWTSWSLCFNSRGVADKNLVLTLTDIPANKQQTITVFPGGGVQTE